MKRRGASRASRASPRRGMAKNISLPTLQGQELYDALYAQGYHSNLNTTRAGEALKVFQGSLPASFGVRSVLDVGCSHGYAVNMLWSLGFVASGVDISSKAVEMAKKWRGEPEAQCVAPCFARGTATSIPWPSKSFDAIISTDALEHVEKNDTDAAVAELSRVARKMLVLKISRSGDFVTPLQRKSLVSYLHEKQQNESIPNNLHPSAYPPQWWIQKFESAHGWKVHHQLAIPHGRPWVCCTFVLIRANASTTMHEATISQRVRALRSVRSSGASNVGELYHVR